MMLREGWDVHNVSVVLGLRPFTAKAEILPEQVIGRGLRLMTADRDQIARRHWRCSARGICSTSCVSSSKPKASVLLRRQTIHRVRSVIEPVQDRLAYDIAIPIPKPRLTHNVQKLSDSRPCQPRSDL